MMEGCDPSASLRDAFSRTEKSCKFLHMGAARSDRQKPRTELRGFAGLSGAGSWEVVVEVQVF